MFFLFFLCLPLRALRLCVRPILLPLPFSASPRLCARHALAFGGISNPRIRSQINNKSKKSQHLMLKLLDGPANHALRAVHFPHARLSRAGASLETRRKARRKAQGTRCKAKSMYQFLLSVGSASLCEILSFILFISMTTTCCGNPPTNLKARNRNTGKDMPHARSSRAGTH
jgi:hypothetical protein